MTHQPEKGKTKCLACPEEANSQIEGAVSCNGNCQAGSVSPGNNNKCEKCPPGQYQAGAGATTCNKCDLGYYQPNSGATSCIQANAGEDRQMLIVNSYFSNPPTQAYKHN